MIVLIKMYNKYKNMKLYLDYLNNLFSLYPLGAFLLLQASRGSLFVGYMMMVWYNIVQLPDRYLQVTGS